MQRQQAFTLIELMIVIAIIGILATMAVPTYQERVIKTQVSEAMVLGDFAKEGVSAFYRANKRMPKNNSEAGLPPPEQTVGNFVTRLEVSDGAIHITMGNRVNRNAAGKILSVRPAVNANYPQLPIAWNCGVAVAPSPMKMAGENRTTLPPVYLPVDCRS